MALKTHQLDNLAHVQAAIDVEDLPGDVAGFVAREKNDRGCDVAAAAEAAEWDHRLHFVFQFGGKRIGHGRGDEPRRNGVYCDVA